MINLAEFRAKRIALNGILVDRFDLFFDGFAPKIIDVLDDYIELGNEYEKQTAELAQAENLLREFVTKEAVRYINDNEEAIQVLCEETKNFLDNLK